MYRPGLKPKTIRVWVRPEVVGVVVKTTREGGERQSLGVAHADAGKTEGCAVEKMTTSVARWTDPVFKTGYNAGVNVGTLGQKKKVKYD